MVSYSIQLIVSDDFTNKLIFRSDYLVLFCWMFELGKQNDFNQATPHIQVIYITNTIIHSTHDAYILHW